MRAALCLFRLPIHVWAKDLCYSRTKQRYGRMLPDSARWSWWLYFGIPCCYRWVITDKYMAVNRLHSVQNKCVMTVSHSWLSLITTLFPKLRVLKLGYAPPVMTGYWETKRYSGRLSRSQHKGFTAPPDWNMGWSRSAKAVLMHVSADIHWSDSKVHISLALTADVAQNTTSCVFQCIKWLTSERCIRCSITA